MTADVLASTISQRPRSPLFARLASNQLAAGNIQDAKGLCREGLLHYPYYTTAHLILARCYEAEHQYEDALQHLDQALQHLPDNSTLNRLKIEWNAATEHPPATAVHHEDAEYIELEPLTEQPNEPQQTFTDESSVDNTASSMQEFIDVDDSPHPQTEADVQMKTSPETDDHHEPAHSELDIVTESFSSEKNEVVPDEPQGRDELTVLENEQLTSENIAPQSQEASPLEQTVTESLPSDDSTEEDPQLIIDTAELSVQDISQDIKTQSPDIAVSPAVVPIIESTIEQHEAIQSEVKTDGQLSSILNDEGRIVSKTLAEIYAKQGAFGDAIITYRLLKQQRPELTAEYDQRIADLELKLREKIPS